MPKRSFFPTISLHDFWGWRLIGRGSIKKKGAGR